MRRLLPFAALVMVACDGSDVTGPLTLPPLPPPGPPAPGLSKRDTQLLGSWELRFERIDGSPTARPSIESRARLDVRGTQDVKVGAALTPRWTRRFAFTKVTVEYDQLVLEEVDDNRSAPTFMSGTERDRWEKFTLPRAADGSLLGSFTAIGFFESTTAGSPERSPLVGSGRLKNDELAPEIRLVPPSKAQAGKWLPWDYMAIELAEPLNQGAVLNEIKAVFPERTFNATDSSTTDSRAETTGFSGYAKTLTGGTRTLTIAPQVKDPSGNLFAPFTMELGIHAVGEARAKHDFDAPADLALWSGAERITDARCEKGGCLYFPPASQNDCTPNGAAGMLTTDGGKIRKVKARVRVLASDASDKPGATVAPFILEPVYLRVGVTSQYEGSTNGTMGMKLVRTGTGDLPWESAWMTMEVGLTGSVPPDLLGFSLSRPVCEFMTIPKFADVQVAILIDEVWAE